MLRPRTLLLFFALVAASPLGSMALAADVTVQYSTASGTATGSDFAAKAGVLTFPPGVTTMTVTVPVIGDRVLEANETFTVNLANAVGANIVDPTGLGTITNDDAAGLSVDDVWVKEPGSSTSTGTFTVTLSPTVGSPATVAYATSPGSAAAVTDYTPVAGVLTFAAGQATATIPVTVTGDLTPEGNETFSIALSNALGAAIASPAGTGTIIDSRRIGDFDGSNGSDIVWRNVGPGAATGAMFIWLMSGTNLGGTYLDPISTDWDIQFTGDFDGDGHADILWREKSTGSLYVWRMKGPLVSAGTGYTASQADNTWQVQGVGDLDGDGKSDILWRNVGPGAATGALYVWLMNGTGIKGSTYLDPISTAWKVQRLGDLNGDGKSDIVWRETSSGNLFIWMMNGAQTIAGTGAPNSQADNTWQVHGLGDFDADGKGDILWRNVGPGASTGALFVWLMNGATIKGATFLDPISTAWQVQGVGEFNGDGKSDILWRETTGSTYIWMMSGPQVITGTGFTASQADNTWQIKLPR